LSLLQEVERLKRKLEAYKKNLNKKHEAVQILLQQVCSLFMKECGMWLTLPMQSYIDEIAFYVITAESLQWGVIASAY